MQVRYKQILRHMESSQKEELVSNIPSSASVESKLPKLRLPSFSGDMREWEGFWEQFVAAVDIREQLPEVTKFLHLWSVLKGEAQAVIAGLALTASNYHMACDLLTSQGAVW